jgi:hypothetical protein
MISLESEREREREMSRILVCTYVRMYVTYVQCTVPVHTEMGSSAHRLGLGVRELVQISHTVHVVRLRIQEMIEPFCTVKDIVRFCHST